MYIIQIENVVYKLQVFTDVLAVISIDSSIGTDRSLRSGLFPFRLCLSFSGSAIYITCDAFETNKDNAPPL